MIIYHIYYQGDHVPTDTYMITEDPRKAFDSFIKYGKDCYCEMWENGEKMESWEIELGCDGQIIWNPLKKVYCPHSRNVIWWVKRSNNEYEEFDPKGIESNE